MPLERKREPGQSGHFMPANPLEELLVRAFREPPLRPEFCRRMLADRVLVLGTATETGVKLRQWTAGERRMIPVFTSRLRLEEFAGDTEEFIAVQGRKAFRMIPAGVSAFLNPRSPIGREFSPEEVASLLASAPEEPEADEEKDGDQET